ncbi:uncharacterized protein [Watersipora subatra]|uniref:uncharacterized protein isoform X2 n=1 Tax=Watersipora subatra TaxID=2589382 RepID=UPI00355C078D
MLLSAMRRHKSSDPTRNRQGSDAKWRANILICYELLKNICSSSDLKPSQMKAGKITRLGSLQMTHQQIQLLEKTVSSLLAEKNKKTGFNITLGDLHSEFAELTRKVHRYQLNARRASLSTTNPAAQPIYSDACLIQASSSSERLIPSTSRTASIADSYYSDIDDGTSSRNSSTCAGIEDSLESLHQWCRENEIEFILEENGEDSQPAFAVVSGHASDATSPSLSSLADHIAKFPDGEGEQQQEMTGSTTPPFHQHPGFSDSASSASMAPDLSVCCCYPSHAVPMHILEDLGAEATGDARFDQSMPTELVSFHAVSLKERAEPHRPPSLAEEYYASEDDVELYNNLFHPDDDKLLSGESDPMLSTDIGQSSALPIPSSTRGNTSLEMLIDMDAQGVEDFQMLPEGLEIFLMDDDKP